MALEAVVKLTKEQYEILANGGTVGPYTGIDNTKYLYFVQDDISAGSSTRPVYFLNGSPLACAHSLEADVPSDADFNNYYHKTGSWNGLTYTAGKVGNPDDLSFTIPTGTTSTTVALGNHNHDSVYLKLAGGAMTGNISYQGTKATYQMIKWIDNTSDANGNGISIGGGGLVVIGAGESSDTITSNAGVSGGNEYMYLGSDNDIYLLTNIQNGWANRKQFSFNSSGNFVVPGSISEGGTSLVDKYIAKTLTSAKGDIIYASAANTPARLPIGSEGQVLKVSGGVPVWGADSNTNTWRNVKVDATQVLGTGTDTGPLAFLSQNTNNGDVSFTYDSTNKGVKATAKIPTALKNPNAIKIQGGGQDVASYDGSAAKTINIAASSTAGAFTISDGTTTKTIQLAGSFTDYNQTIKVGNTTFGANAAIELIAGNNVDSIVANTTNNTITINTHDTTYTTATTTAAGLMSAADKTKLDGIASGAEVNVQSDWSVADSSSDAFIKNKPTIPVVTNYYWADVQVSASSNKGTTPTVSKITIGGSGSTAGKATMQYNATEDCIDFVFA